MFKLIWKVCLIYFNRKWTRTFQWTNTSIYWRLGSNSFVKVQNSEGGNGMFWMKTIQLLCVSKTDKSPCNKCFDSVIRVFYLISKFEKMKKDIHAPATGWYSWFTAANNRISGFFFASSTVSSWLSVAVICCLFPLWSNSLWAKALQFMNPLFMASNCRAFKPMPHTKCGDLLL